MKIDDSTSSFVRPDATTDTTRQLVAVKDPLAPEVVEGSGRTHTESPLAHILDGVNARAMTPRQVSNLGDDLYSAGILDFDEYADMAFQPDLHPDFAKTIGALTGDVALPDQPRDYIKLWEEKYDFASRHRTEDSDAPERALHILSVLRRLDNPTNVET